MPIRPIRAAGRYPQVLRRPTVGLTPKGWRWLAAGFAAVTVCGVMFAALLDGVLDGEGVAAVDGPLTAWVAGHRTRALTGIFRALTGLGSAAVLIPLTAVAAAVLGRRARSWRPLWIAALTLAGSQALVYTVKMLVERTRPGNDVAVVSASGYSFPSGHATSSLAAFGILALLAANLTTRRLTRVTIWVVAAAAAAGIGLSRIYLGVHYLSDVLAAWALGAGWLTAVAVLTLTHPLKQGQPDPDAHQAPARG